MKIPFAEKFHEIKAKAKEKLEDPSVRMTVVSTGILVGTLTYRIWKDIKHQRDMSIWSFGEDSILKVGATDEEAAAYNRFIQAFYDAQKKVLNETGTRWDPTNALRVECKNSDLKSYNRIADRISEALEHIDQDKTPIDDLGDFLIKNQEN